MLAEVLVADVCVVGYDGVVRLELVLPWQFSSQPVECAPVSVTCNTCPPLEPALLHQTKDAKDESALHQQAFISGTRASP